MSRELIAWQEEEIKLSITGGRKLFAAISIEPAFIDRFNNLMRLLFEQ